MTADFQFDSGVASSVSVPLPDGNLGDELIGWLLVPAGSFAGQAGFNSETITEDANCLFRSYQRTRDATIESVGIEFTFLSSHAYAICFGNFPPGTWALQTEELGASPYTWTPTGDAPIAGAVYSFGSDTVDIDPPAGTYDQVSLVLTDNMAADIIARMYVFDNSTAGGFVLDTAEDLRYAAAFTSSGRRWGVGKVRMGGGAWT